MTSWTNSHILSLDDKSLPESGNYMEPGITDMLSLKMLKGTRNGLNDPASILLSQSVAKAFFGDADPINKLMKIDKKLNEKSRTSPTILRLATLCLFRPFNYSPQANITPPGLTTPGAPAGSKLWFNWPIMQI